jgi:YlmC/YmxH family sporulation protein
MRLSEFAGKKIINIYDGDILGTAGESDLLVDPITGEIAEIILPPGRGAGFFSGAASGRRQLSIPWEAVKKIGSEIIVVDIDEDGKYIR